jgi:hypothetical protein
MWNSSALKLFCEQSAVTIDWVIVTDRDEHRRTRTSELNIPSELRERLS